MGWESGIVLPCSGVLGLLIGSFLTVVVYRVPRGESVVWPGSRCPACGVPITAARNIPVVSWLVLRGRCSACRGGISPQYPIIEATTAALFVAVTARLGLTAALPAFLYLAAVSVALAVIDVRVRRLPNAIVGPSYPIALLALVGAAVASGQVGPLARAVVAMAALLALYSLLAASRPGGLGLGDVKLAGLLGLYLGWLGWDAVIVGTLAGFLLAATVGVGLIAAGRARAGSAMAFGPWMVTGAMVAVFAASPITGWYLSLLGSAL